MYCFKYYNTSLNGYLVRNISTSSVKLKKKKIHWAVLAKKKFPTDRALMHFDDFYKSIFRIKWPSVRLALLCPQKYVALVNNFGDNEKTEKLLTEMGAMDLRVLFEIYSRTMEQYVDDGRSLDERSAMDRLIDDKLLEVDEPDLKLLYPEGTEKKLQELLNMNKDDSETVEEDDNNSMSMTNDFYEEDRVVYPDNGQGGSLQNFIPAGKLKGLDDYIPESEHYAYYKSTSDIPIEVKKCEKLNYPKYLKVFSFPKSDISEYPNPMRGVTGVYNYFLMDGASILPVLALDVQPGERVLDMCAAPGGKSLAILQTMLAGHLVCNDISKSRTKRIHNVMGQFLYDFDSKWKDMITVQQMDGTAFEGSNIYDKILVDAPCTNDRLSLHDNENNIFKQMRLKERLRLPESQAALLTNALRIVKPGGSVVYSTCSLSPIQNDGVVSMALRRLWEEQRLEFTIIDFSVSAIMGSATGKAVEGKIEPIIVDGKKLKPCCACPETKKERDACIIENGETNCTALIEAHKACMRKMGFKI